MDTNQIGKITELEVLSYIIKKGYSVSIPFGDKDRYDQIWDINGKLLRVQVKTSHWYKGEQSAIEFSCSTNYVKRIGNVEHRYTKNEIDFFATYWNNKVYLIPIEECSSKKVLRFTAKQIQGNICWAKNYEFEEVIKHL